MPKIGAAGRPASEPNPKRAGNCETWVSLKNNPLTVFPATIAQCVRLECNHPAALPDGIGSCAELQELCLRGNLLTELPARLTRSHRAFLSGMVRGEQDWSLMSCPHFAELPAIRWKLENLRRLKKSNAAKFRTQAEKLDAEFAHRAEVRRPPRAYRRRTYSTGIQGRSCQ